jgi:hypothetical protein
VIVLRKQTIPLATALGRVITTLLANPMGISITALLMTVLRRQIKSGAYDPLEKVTGHQDDKPSTAETSQENTHARETAAGENEVFNNTLLGITNSQEINPFTEAKAIIRPYWGLKEYSTGKHATTNVLQAKLRKRWLKYWDVNPINH